MNCNCGCSGFTVTYSGGFTVPGEPVDSGTWLVVTRQGGIRIGVYDDQYAAVDAAKDHTARTGDATVVCTPVRWFNGCRRVEEVDGKPERRP